MSKWPNYVKDAVVLMLIAQKRGNSLFGLLPKAVIIMFGEYLNTKPNRWIERAKYILSNSSDQEINHLHEFARAEVASRIHRENIRNALITAKVHSRVRKLVEKLQSEGVTKPNILIAAKNECLEALTNHERWCIKTSANPRSCQMGNHSIDEFETSYESRIGTWFGKKVFCKTHYAFIISSPINAANYSVAEEVNSIMQTKKGKKNTRGHK